MKGVKPTTRQRMFTKSIWYCIADRVDDPGLGYWIHQGIQLRSSTPGDQPIVLWIEEGDIGAIDAAAEEGERPR